MLHLFQTRDGPFFSSSHLSTLGVLFLLYHPKIFIPCIVLATVRLSLFRNGTLFLLQKTLSTNVTIVSEQGWANFLFGSMFKKYLSHILLGGARWLSGRVSDSGARGPGFETYHRRVVSLSKTLYSPKVLVNYPGSDGSVPT